MTRERKNAEIGRERGREENDVEWEQEKPSEIKRCIIQMVLARSLVDSGIEHIRRVLLHREIKVLYIVIWELATHQSMCVL